MSNKLEKIIQEDLVNHSTNKGGYGYDWHNYQRPEQMNLVDILKMDPNELNAVKKVLPHQIQSVFDQLIELYDDASILQAQFTKALSNPMIHEDEQSKEKIKSVIEKFDKTIKMLNEIAEEVNSLQM